MSSSAVGLQSLPPELGALVLGHLCARDVLRTAAACKALRAIACATTTITPSLSLTGATLSLPLELCPAIADLCLRPLASAGPPAAAMLTCASTTHAEQPGCHWHWHG